MKRFRTVAFAGVVLALATSSFGVATTASATPNQINCSAGTYQSPGTTHAFGSTGPWTSSLGVKIDMTGCVDDWTQFPGLNAVYTHAAVARGHMGVVLKYGQEDCLGPNTWATATVSITWEDAGGVPIVVGSPPSTLRTKATGWATSTGNLTTGATVVVHTIPVVDANHGTGSLGAFDLTFTATTTTPPCANSGASIRVMPTAASLSIH